MKYLGVVVENNTDKTDRLFSYICKDDAIEVGAKVFVPFGRGKALKSGYVFTVTDEPPLGVEPEKLKEIAGVDDEVSLSEEMIDCCRWMKKRYLCRYIEAVNQFLPAGSPSKRGKKRIPKAEDMGENDNIESLTEEQTSALTRLKAALDEAEKGNIFLIHGVTGSGKTEIYIRIIAEALERGRNAVMMVPEISLTPQVISRFEKRFGASKIAVLHSKLSMGERYDEWQRIAGGEVRVVIGARSAVFAPLRNIGVIVMDEEHESSYKADMSPKYDTVEVAARRAAFQSPKALLILGSATPSVVSYRRAEEGIYEKLTLKKRYNEVALPEVEIVDMRSELKAGNRSVFSYSLRRKTEETLAKGKQAIFFLNRRGFAGFISCRECGYVMKCPDCDISLSYHKSQNKAVCHYCGRSLPLPKTCPDCGSKYIKLFGAGTEQLEEAAIDAFPGAGVARLDLDTARLKGAATKILKDFRQGKTDILVGTQLVAKGLDFENVGLVGIAAADIALNVPDFRASERCFQLITQAAGRAGRGEERGQVVIQTYTPSHYAIECAARHDYEGFYKIEERIRRDLKYPPYSDFIRLNFSAKSEGEAKDAAERAHARLGELLGERLFDAVYEPQRAYIAKADGKYKYYVLIKAPKAERGIYLGAVAKLKEENSEAGGESILVDINPYGM